MVVSVSSGRYGFVDRVIDGISICVHEMDVRATSRLFKASVNLSYVTLSSKKPNWNPGPLHFTFIQLPEKNSVLIFKEISWESTRFEADGLAAHMTPVKVITNHANLRVVLKKRLSDSSFICAKLSFLVKSLLWVLTVSQLEAVLFFLKSIRHHIQLSSQHEKSFSPDVGKQPPSNPPSGGGGGHMGRGPGDSAFSLPAVGGASDPRLAKTFDFYDVRENSFSCQIHLIEIHFCEDSLRAVQMSTQLAKCGSVRMSLKNLHFDYFPLHLKEISRLGWGNYDDINRSRTQWMDSLKPNSDPESWIRRHFQTSNANVHETVIVFHLQDIALSCVMLDSYKTETESWPLLVECARPYNRKTIVNALDGEQRSLMSSAFIASDTLMHKLDTNADLISADLTQCRSLGSTEGELPTILFVQVNPLHLRFDVDTLIWLHAFLLNLRLNLQSVFDEPLEPAEHPSAPPLFCRIEALRPRVIFPLCVPPSPGPEPPRAPEYPWIGPTALVVQVDTMVLQILPNPLSVPMMRNLEYAVDSLQKQLRPLSAWGREHTPPDLARFRHFTDPNKQTMSVNDKSQDILVCINCPTVWAEFLTICEAATRSHTGPSFKTYRQSFFDPAPFTCWALKSYPLRRRSPAPPRHAVRWCPNLARSLSPPPPQPEPLNVIIDFDTSTSPVSMYAGKTSACSSTTRKPLRFTLGHSGAVFTFRSVKRLRLPDAVDHLVFLYGLAHRVSRLKNGTGLDFADIVERHQANGDVKHFHEWVLTAKCLLTHGVQVEVASTADARFVDPPPDYEVEDGAVSLASSLSSLPKDSENLVDGTMGRNPVTKSIIDDGNKASFDVSQSKTHLGGFYDGQASRLGQSRGLENPLMLHRKPSQNLHYNLSSSASMMSLDSEGSTFNDSVSIPHSGSLEALLPDDEILNEVFVNSSESITFEEVGVDASNVENVNERSATIMDEEQAVHFPPWEVKRLMLDLNDLSVDVEITTIEVRMWLGVGSVNFVDPDDCEVDPQGYEATNSDSSNISDVDDDDKAFLITLRLGGDFLPGRPHNLLSDHDGWVALRIGMQREVTLHPIPTTWEVVEALLGHLTSRGGVRACRWVVTREPGAGLTPLHNPAELIDLSFCLEKGHLVLDLSGRPRGNRRSKDSTMKRQSKAPIQKIKFLQGFSASLNNDGVLEVCGATPAASESVVSMAPTITPTPPNHANCPPLPPKRPPPPTRLHDGSAAANRTASLAEENAKLRLMIERLNAQVLSLSTDLAKLKLRYPS
uniref:Chorein_N domain-containing protein n=1 Tax=Mesocestoides corti TaxID=53468 RepID=A0A5K3ENS5_MESCO